VCRRWRCSLEALATVYGECIRLRLVPSIAIEIHLLCRLLALALLRETGQAEAALRESDSCTHECMEGEVSITGRMDDDELDDEHAAGGWRLSQGDGQTDISQSTTDISQSKTPRDNPTTPAGASGRGVSSPSHRAAESCT
jgi:hypothetical protein